MASTLLKYLSSASKKVYGLKLQIWSATSKFEKEPRSWGGEAQAFSRSQVKLLMAIREVRWGVNCLDFLRKILPRDGLERANGCWPFSDPDVIFIQQSAPTDCTEGKVHQSIQAICDDFMVGKIERSFAKDLSNPFKTFVLWQHCLLWTVIQIEQFKYLLPGFFANPGLSWTLPPFLA